MFHFPSLLARPEQVSMLDDASALRELRDFDFGSGRVVLSDKSVHLSQLLLLEESGFGNGNFGRVLIKQDPDTTFFSFVSQIVFRMSQRRQSFLCQSPQSILFLVFFIMMLLLFSRVNPSLLRTAFSSRHDRDHCGARAQVI